MEEHIIQLSSCNREHWVRELSLYLNELQPNEIKDGYITISMSEDIHETNVLPFHIVLLACFIESIHSMNYKVIIDSLNRETQCYFDETFKTFFVGGQNYIEPSQDNILNLWKVVNEKAISYSMQVTRYLNNEYFNEYDMTKLKVALDEVYANIADHSQSDGNAFSYIKYIQQDKKIYVAVCDFGLGIAKTLRDSNTKYISDKDALRDSIKIGVSAKTNMRNKGYGLDSIISTLSENDILRIVSNRGMLKSSGNRDINIYDLDFEFKGTLIYFEISTDSFPIKEIEDEVVIF